MRRPRGHAVRTACTATLLLLALVTAGGRAWGQAPSPSDDTYERAASLIRSRSFASAEDVLHGILAADPSNRRAREMLAFALECTADLEGERRVRSALAAEYPDDARIQADYGRVLERAGDAGAALRAYRRARELNAGQSDPDLDVAIERTRDRTAIELAAPVMIMSEPGATASRVQAGAALPAGSRRHVALVGTRFLATGATGSVATASAALALALVQNGSGVRWSAGPSFHAVAIEGGARPDIGVGGTIAGDAALGPALEAEGRAEAETPWDEAAVAVLHGGRASSAEGHLYAHGLSRRLLLQVGARRRRLSILPAEPGSSHRPEAWQSLWLAGADVVLWRATPTMRGEMLDEAMIAPTTLASALTLAYRHYDVSTRSTPGFAALIGLAPRASADEVSVHATAASPGGRVGVALGTGTTYDAARGTRGWSAGGALVWAPLPATRIALAYDEASEIATGLLGRRRTGSLSFHVDL